MDNPDYIDKIGSLLRNTTLPLKLRFRALFTLKNLGDREAIDQISASFNDRSALLKHELAYCLGQMKNSYASSTLISILADKSQEIVVRHEAAEALAAIGNPDVIDVLQLYVEDDAPEVAETCQLGIGRLKFLLNGGQETKNAYGTVDPTPPSSETNVTLLQNIFLDETKSLYERYQSMFALRDLNHSDSIKVLNKGLKCGSVLFRHEVAFVLGQLQSPLSVTALKEVVEDKSESDIVRHESVEALGSIGTSSCFEIIKSFLHDEKTLVRESCEIALDMCDYENSSEFQYANGLEIVAQKQDF